MTVFTDFPADTTVKQKFTALFETVVNDQDLKAYFVSRWRVFNNEDLTSNENIIQ